MAEVLEFMCTQVEQICVESVSWIVDFGPLHDAASEDEEDLLWPGLQLELVALRPAGSSGEESELLEDKVVLSCKTPQGPQPFEQVLELRVLVPPTLRGTYSCSIEAIWKAVFRDFSLSSWYSLQMNT